MDRTDNAMRVTKEKERMMRFGVEVRLLIFALLPEGAECLLDGLELVV